jgi:hypothetical protein
MVRVLHVLRAAVAACVLVGVAATGTAGAQSACENLGGTVGPDHTCHARTVTSGYTLDLSFPTTYPDQQPLTEYLIKTRDGFADFAQLPPDHDWSYSLLVKSTTYQSGPPDSGTQSVVLRLSQDANPRPVTYYKAFNYNLDTQAPIALDTLFEPGARPLDVVFPAVRRELEKRWQPEVLASMLGPASDSTFENFALTDDAVIFFIGQGQLLGHPDGPLEVTVPRTELGLSAVRGMRA